MKLRHEPCAHVRIRSVERWLRLPAILATATVLVSLGCSPNRHPDETGTDTIGGGLTVVVQRPTTADSARELILPGSVEAWETTTLFGRVTGYLASISVDIGDRVDAGAELARIVVPEMTAELASARARVAAAKAAQELARITEDRTRSLRERNPEAISRQNVDQAAAKAQMAVAETSVAEAELQRLNTLMRFSILSAPFDGQITKRYLDPGALVSEGSNSNAQPVLEIARTSRLRLAFDVPEPVVPRVAPGEVVTIMLDAFPGRTIHGSVARTAGALDPRTRSMRAEVDLENASNEYRPGMYGKVSLKIDAAEGVLVVPSKAVHGSRDSRFVLVARNGTLERQPIVVIADDGRKSVVSQGLTMDTLVMISGSPLAAEGSNVDAVEESTP